MKRNWLIEKRLLKQLTQQQVADAVGISRSYYSDIENGNRSPSGKVAKAIADFLVFSMDLFFKMYDAKCVVSETQTSA